MRPCRGGGNILFAKNNAVNAYKDVAAKENFASAVILFCSLHITNRYDGISDNVYFCFSPHSKSSSAPLRRPSYERNEAGGYCRPTAIVSLLLTPERISSQGLKGGESRSFFVVCFRVERCDKLVLQIP